MCSQRYEAPASIFLQTNKGTRPGDLETVQYGFVNLLSRVSQNLLFSANSAIFQLYHCENNLIFNAMMMRSALF